MRACKIPLVPSPLPTLEVDDVSDTFNSHDRWSLFLRYPSLVTNLQGMEGEERVWERGYVGSQDSPAGPKHY